MVVPCIHISIFIDFLMEVLQRVFQQPHLHTSSYALEYLASMGLGTRVQHWTRRKVEIQRQDTLTHECIIALMRLDSPPPFAASCSRNVILESAKGEFLKTKGKYQGKSPFNLMINAIEVIDDTFRVSDFRMDLQAFHGAEPRRLYLCIVEYIDLLGRDRSEHFELYLCAFVNEQDFKETFKQFMERFKMSNFASFEEIFEHFVERFKKVEELPLVLWAYRTTARTATGETPYSLSFGTEAVIPIEIGVPNYRTRHFLPNCNEATLRAELNLLEKRRDQAVIRATAYQEGSIGSYA
ncbi:hypothetical protein FNV43_RR21212 [Rhamnella rubrinervis]|uniref:Uncharacterized protein n=1 Tax=Rhamnella rubrinervis TaxID=2594499 RepID=A0A8K0E2X6_9ROSA|nr:hypothetical protein FNV43_RR21212 [Rhamnella rubrinervis]